MQRQQFENMDTSNLYMDKENVFEDATVSTQAADFAKAQALQSQSNTMDQFSQAAGGSGIAALAQAMAGSSNQQAQASSGDLKKQEITNERNTMAEAGRIQDQQIEGEYTKRDHELGKIDTLMQLTGQELQAAQAAKSASDQMLIGGVGDALGMATPNMAQFLKGKPKNV